MADRLGGAEAAEPTAGREVAPMGEAEEEAARIKIAGTGRVDDPADPRRLDNMGMLARYDNRAFLAAGQGGDVAMRPHAARRLVEIVGLVERADLRLVGEEDIDVMRHQLAELGAVPPDAERVAEAEADAPPGAVGELCRLAEGRLGARRIEEIAFEIGDLRRRDQLRVDILGAEIDAGAEEGLHRAMRIGGNQDETARGRRPA